MPVIFRLKGYAVYFVMFDLNEPIHVHIRQSGKEAKYWIEPLALAWNRGYELNEIESLLRRHHSKIIESWNKEQQKRQ